MAGLKSACPKINWLGLMTCLTGSNRMNPSGSDSIMKSNRRTKEDTSTIPTCVQCRSEMNYGENVIEIKRGVLGHRGFVPLDDPELICSLRCLREYGRRDEGDESDERLDFLKRAA